MGKMLLIRQISTELKKKKKIQIEQFLSEYKEGRRN